MYSVIYREKREPFPTKVLEIVAFYEYELPATFH